MTKPAYGVLALYQNRTLCIWVEDPVTKSYLDVIWEGAPITVLVAGGATGVAALATAARQEKLGHVFGLRDRDFGPAAMPPTHLGPVYALPRHEVENYLLDFDALAAAHAFNKSKRGRQAIAAKARELAGKHAAWMACVHVLRDLAASAGAFPEDPVPGEVTDGDSAEVWLRANTATLRAPATATTLSTLPVRIEHYAKLLDGDAWIDSFSGKEVFAALASWFWPGSKRHDRGRLAAAIAEQQRAQGRIPADVDRLRLELLKQVGRTP